MPRLRRGDKEDRHALAETNAAAVQSCNGLAPGVTDLPIEQIKDTVRPTGDQLAALDALRPRPSRRKTPSRPRAPRQCR